MIKAEKTVQVGDIVFCLIKKINLVSRAPNQGDTYFGHRIKKIDLVSRNGANTEERRFTIANYRGREDGTCFSENIYGKFVKVMKADPGAKPPPKGEGRGKGKEGKGRGTGKGKGRGKGKRNGPVW